MKQQQSRKICRSKEKGVALLFSLGVLGLMTVLALTFASVSMTNKTIAENNIHQQFAKNYAKSLIDRIRFASAEYINPSSPTDGFTIKPQNLHRFFSSGPDKHFDHLWRLGLSGSSIESALFNVDYQGAFAYDTNANPTWQYIKNTDADNEIVGRYAYMVIAADRPLADLSTMVFARKEPLKEGATEKRTPGTATDYQRAGLVPEELNPNILWNAIASPTAYASTFNAEIGKLENQTFSSYEQLDPFVNKTATTATQLEEKLKNFSSVIVNDAFSEGTRKFPELFVSQTDRTKQYHRFNIYKIFKDWEGSKPSLTDRQNLVNRMINEGLIKEYTAEKVTDNSLPWLAKFENPADNPNQNKQIAANIVDFFTESTEPTSNLTDADWSKAVESNTAPEYTGLKKTSYISGIGVDIKLDATQEVTPIADTTNFTHTYHISVTATPIVEIINMYEGLTDETLTATLNGDLTFTLNLYQENTESAAVVKTLDMKLSDTGKANGFQVVTLESSSKGPEAYRAKLLSLKPFTFEAQIGEFSFVDADNVLKPLYYEIKNIVFKPQKVSLNSVGESTSTGIDFAVIDANDTTGKVEDPTTPVKQEITATDTFSGNPATIAYRVSDPRHNLPSSAWNRSVKLTDGGFWATAETPNVTNTKDAVASGSDTAYKDIYKNSEDAYAPLSAPTYLPQKAMKTPWELGAIHRGEPWRTLNLLTYNDSLREGLGGTSYDKGDANLLDQIKFTDETVQYGKININELSGTIDGTPGKNMRIIDALLKNVTTVAESDGGSKDTALTETGSKLLLTPSDVEVTNDLFGVKSALATALFNKKNTGDITKRYFAFRSEILSDANVKEAFKNKQKDDAGQEELFLKTVMLLDAEQTWLPRRIYVIGLVQVIRDLGPVAPAKTTAYRDWNQSGTFSENAKKGIGLYSAGYQYPEVSTSPSNEMTNAPTLSGSIDTQKGTYDNGADQILAEQKVFAVLDRDYNSRTWKIVRFEYVD